MDAPAPHTRLPSPHPSLHPLPPALGNYKRGETKFGDDFHQTFSRFLVAVVIIVIVVVPAVGACP